MSVRVYEYSWRDVESDADGAAAVAPRLLRGGLWDTNRVVEPICSCRSVIDRSGAQCVPLTAAGNIGGQMVVPPRTFFNLGSPATILFIYFLLH